MAKTEPTEVPKSSSNSGLVSSHHLVDQTNNKVFSVPSFGLSNKVSGPEAVEESINTVQEYLRELEKPVMGLKTDEERFRVLEITLGSMRDHFNRFYEKVISNKELQQSKANKELRQSLFNLKVELDSVNAIVADKRQGITREETEVIFKRISHALNEVKWAAKNAQNESSLLNDFVTNLIGVPCALSALWGAFFLGGILLEALYLLICERVKELINRFTQTKK